MFAPLRMVGVPEPLIDVVEPFFRVLVELGYDRSIPLWEPTPARLIPRFDPEKVATDLAYAIGEGINNAAALIGSPPPLSIPAPVTLAAPATETAKADMSPQVTSSDIDQLGDRIPHVTTSSTPTQTQQLSSASADASEFSTTPTPEPSASAAPPEPAKPAGHPAKPRPAVRDSLGATERPRGFPHRSKDPATSTTGTTAADPATTAGSSLAASAPAAPSSAAGNSSAGDSSGGDADGPN